LCSSRGGCVDFVAVFATAFAGFFAGAASFFVAAFVGGAFGFFGFAAAFFVVVVVVAVEPVAVVDDAVVVEAGAGVAAFFAVDFF